MVDKGLKIREDKLEICSLPRITSVDIATTIKDVLTRLGKPICDCPGIGHHGASNMNSEIIFVPALIRNDAHKAVYIHYNGDCPILVITHSCSIATVIR